MFFDVDENFDLTDRRRWGSQREGIKEWRDSQVCLPVGFLDVDVHLVVGHQVRTALVHVVLKHADCHPSAMSSTTTGSPHFIRH